MYKLKTQEEINLIYFKDKDRFKMIFGAIYKHAIEFEKSDIYSNTCRKMPESLLFSTFLMLYAYKELHSQIKNFLHSDQYKLLKMIIIGILAEEIQNMKIDYPETSIIQSDIENRLSSYEEEMFPDDSFDDEFSFPDFEDNQQKILDSITYFAIFDCSNKINSEFDLNSFINNSNFNFVKTMAAKGICNIYIKNMLANYSKILPSLL